jgi:hypothetical protein
MIDLYNSHTIGCLLLVKLLLYIVVKVFILRQNYKYHTAINGLKYIESVLFHDSTLWSRFNFRAAMILYIPPSTGYKFASPEDMQTLHKENSNLLFVRIVERIERYILCQQYKMATDIMSVYDIKDRKTIYPYPWISSNNRLVICYCKQGNIQELVLVDLD